MQFPLQTLSFLLLFCLSAMAQAIPVLQVEVANQDGAQTGRQLAKIIAQQFPDFAQDYDRFLADTLAPYEWAQWVQRAQQVRDAVPQSVRDEVDALAQRLAQVNQDQLGDGHLSAQELWVVQVLLEAENLSQGVGLGVLNPASSVRGPMVGRTLNGLQNPALLRLRAITLYRGSNKTLVNIGFAGFVGILTGYNSDGLFVAYLPSPQPSARPDAQAHMAVTLYLRTLLEENDRITQTLPGLVYQQFLTSHNLLLADNRTVQVLEQSLPSTSYLRSADSPLRTEMQWSNPWQIAAVDCFVLRASPANCNNSGDLVRWHRLQTLARFTPEEPATITDMQSILLDQSQAPYQSIFAAETLYASVFLPLERRLFLYTQSSITRDGLPVFEEIEIPMPHRYTLDTVPFYQKVLILVIFSALLGIVFMALRQPLPWVKPTQKVL